MANAILVREGHKGPKRAKADLADSLCDILFDLLLLAHHYGVDLDAEYPKMLDQLRQRIAAGQFAR